MFDVLMKVSGKSVKIVSVQFTIISYDKISLIVKGICDSVTPFTDFYTLSENYVLWNLNLSYTEHNIFKELFSPLKYKFKKYIPKKARVILNENRYELRMLCNNYVSFIDYLMSEDVPNRDAIYIVNSLINTIERNKQNYAKAVHDRIFAYESNLFNDLISIDEIYSFVHKQQAFKNSAL